MSNQFQSSSVGQNLVVKGTRVVLLPAPHWHHALPRGAFFGFLGGATIRLASVTQNTPRPKQDHSVFYENHTIQALVFYRLRSSMSSLPQNPIAKSLEFGDRTTDLETPPVRSHRRRARSSRGPNHRREKLDGHRDTPPLHAFICSSSAMACCFCLASHIHVRSSRWVLNNGIGGSTATPRGEMRVRTGTDLLT